MSENFDEAKWFDTTTEAPNPGGVILSRRKLKWFRDRLSWGHRFLGVGTVPPQRWALHLEKGLASAAQVIELKPHLLISVYSNEFDCVVVLRFRQGLPAPMPLRTGQHLMAVSTYTRPPANRRSELEEDLLPSPGVSSTWFGFHPVISEFLTDDPQSILGAKAQIESSEWDRLVDLTKMT